ncbi:MAG: hypothetical protein FWD48_10605 [Oscillospiraceae bacterium]|nr:hypothetical protein [Oscillospiraceae bacterium]
MTKKLLIFLSVIILFSACGADLNSADETPYGQIYLYGETHGSERIMQRQLELWHEYYHNENMRHLFVELPYYTAEFLNLWIKADSDEILDELLNDISGTAIDSPFTRFFYQTIKTEYPETIFHGTDIGHQHETTGQRFLRELEARGLEDSEQYQLAQEAIEQGVNTYRNFSFDNEYREEKMTENFIREFDKLNGQSIMGIYGYAHTEFGFIMPSVPTMAENLRAIYSDAVHSVNLANEPIRVDLISVGGKEYQAFYFGAEDISALGLNFVSREFWRLENAYDDFKNHSKTGDFLPFNNYPMPLETGQVFVIDYTTIDDSVVRMYYRSDGNTWRDSPATEEFIIS